VHRKYLIVVPRPSPAALLVVHRRALFIYRDAQAVARGGARCASKSSLVYTPHKQRGITRIDFGKVLHRFAQLLPAAPRR
jgi:hypothetical protein